MSVVCQQDHNRMKNRTIPLKEFELTSILLIGLNKKLEEFRPKTLIADLIVIWGRN